MMQAIIQIGGKQYPVAPSQVLRVERLRGQKGDRVEFYRVLARKQGSLEVGNPLVAGAKVVATILAHGRGKKIRVLKYKRKKQYRRTIGHRQAYTEVRIDEIIS